MGVASISLVRRLHFMDLLNASPRDSENDAI
jgi:hypothetical protein